MIMHRFCKNLNFIGNQWSGFYSLGDWFCEPQNQMYLSALMVIGKLYFKNILKPIKANHKQGNCYTTWWTTHAIVLWLTCILLQLPQGLCT